MKNKKDKFKATEKQISDYLSVSQYNKAILWLLTIPKEELSDSMLEAYNKMKKDGLNEIWLIDYFEQKLGEEIQDFVKWNDNFLNVGTSL